MQGARGQCSNTRRVSNKRWVSIKRRGFEVCVLINAGGVYLKFFSHKRRGHLLEVLRYGIL